MTSKSLSSAKTFTIQRQLIDRKLWLIAILAVYELLKGPVLAAIAIGAERNTFSYLNLSAELQRPRLIAAVREMYGLASPLFFMTVIWGVIFGLQAFSYLFDARKIDFYESQPLKRDKRFFHSVLSSALTYLVMTLVGTLLTMLIAGALGALNGAVAMEMLMQTVQMFLLFLAHYMITALGALVSGNLVIAFFAALFFFIAEAGALLVYYLYKSSFLVTFFSGRLHLTIYSSPLYHFLGGYTRVHALNATAQTLANRMAAVTGPCIKVLLVAVVAFGLCFLAYRMRKPESAGDTIVFQPVRLLIKVVAATEIGLALGLGVAVIMGEYRTHSVAHGVMLLVFAALTAVFLEAIFELDIKALFKRPWQIALSVVVPFVIFLIFRTGYFGFDTYVPEASRVESFAMMRDIYEQYQDESNNSVSILDYCEQQMHLSDVEAGCEILRLGEEYALYLNEGGGWQELAYEGGRYPVSVVMLMRMKNGRKVYREVTLPPDIDAALMDRAIGTPDYWEAIYPYLTGPFAQAYEARLLDDKDADLRIEGLLSARYLPKSKWADFKEAYRKDLQQQYSYSMQQESAPRFVLETRTSRYNDRTYYDIYPEYTQTIAFLKANGIETELAGAAKNIKAVRVEEDIYTYMDDAYGNAGEEITLDMLIEARKKAGLKADIIRDESDLEVAVITKTYSQEKEIVQLMESVMPSGTNSNWNNLTTDNGLRIVVERADSDTSDEYYDIINNKLPDFLRSDFAY